MTFQHAVNGRIAAQVRSPIPGTLINYVVGSVGLALIWVLKLALTGGLPTLPAEPWLYTGGVLGCINLVLSALLIRHIGVLLTGISTAEVLAARIQTAPRALVERNAPDISPGLRDCTSVATGDRAFS